MGFWHFRAWVRLFFIVCGLIVCCSPLLANTVQTTHKQSVSHKKPVAKKAHAFHHHRHHAVTTKKPTHKTVHHHKTVKHHAIKHSTYLPQAQPRLVDDEPDQDNALDHVVSMQSESDDVKSLIHEALYLSKQHLGYVFGSANPESGGMDCSGTISFLLKDFGMTSVPRQADQLYKWVWEKGEFYAVNAHHFDSFEFAHLKPGDLLFWTDTYQVERDPPITHVMLYLGKDKQGKPMMFGASEGRGENNEHLRGVRVFDFDLPKNNLTHHARFIGYGTIPGINYS